MAISFEQIEQNLKTEARQASGKRKVTWFSLRQGYDENHPMPYVAKHRRTWTISYFNEYCTANLARYLTRYPRRTKMPSPRRRRTAGPSSADPGRQGLPARICVLGIPVYDMKNFKTGRPSTAKRPAACPIRCSTIFSWRGSARQPFRLLRCSGGDEAMDKEERWAFWQRNSRCIRCYACRKACPMCYCDPCFIDQNKPKWGEKSPESPTT
jgi:hypothetical protein